MKPESLRRPSTIRKTLYSFILSKKEGISGTWATNNPERQRVRSRTWKDCLELLKESKTLVAKDQNESQLLY
jgi:hypothetical protein